MKACHGERKKDVKNKEGWDLVGEADGREGTTGDRPMFLNMCHEICEFCPA